MLVQYDRHMKPRNFWSILDVFDEAFDHPWSLWTIGREQSIRHLTEAHHVEVNDKCMTVAIEVPGVKPTDLEVTIADRVLTVTGQQRGRNLVYKYLIENGYDVDNIGAALADGILTLTITKTAKATIKKIDIKLDVSSNSSK